MLRRKQFNRLILKGFHIFYKLNLCLMLLKSAVTEKLLKQLKMHHKPSPAIAHNACDFFCVALYLDFEFFHNILLQSTLYYAPPPKKKNKIKNLLQPSIDFFLPHIAVEENFIIDFDLPRRGWQTSGEHISPKNQPRSVLLEIQCFNTKRT